MINIQCAAEHQPSVWKTKTGELRFATSKGVVAFDPAAIPVNMQPPPLALESVLVDGLPVTLQAQIQLAHDYKKIEFADGSVIHHNLGDRGDQGTFYSQKQNLQRYSLR